MKIVVANEANQTLAIIEIELAGTTLKPHLILTTHETKVYCEGEIVEA